MDEPSFIRYLESKKGIDDRSINRRVWDAAMERLRRGAPRVLELGGGIGTMVERVAADGRVRPASWTLLDREAGLVDQARLRLADRIPFPVSFVVDEAEHFCSISSEQFDLVVAHAFLDLVDPSRLLPLALRRASPSAGFLFTVNFDGLTAWEPQVDPELDDRIVRLDHRPMDARRVNGRPSGDSRSGRHLLTLLPSLGFQIVEAGASDWVVVPRGGRYDEPERYFLSCILGFFQESLSQRTEVAPSELARWLRARRAQLSDGTLVFMAHQLDVLAAAGE